MTVSHFRVHSSTVYRQRPGRCPTCDESIISAHSSNCSSCKEPLPRIQEALDPARDLGRAEKSGGRLLHLSDLHVESSDPVGLGYLERWLLVAREVDADAVVVSGDLVEKPDDRAGLEQVRDALERCGRAWAVVPGNHDLRLHGRTRSLFYEIFGEYPQDRCVAGVHLLLLDSNRSEGLPRSRKAALVEETVALRSDLGVLGAVGTDQLSGVEKKLAAEPELSRVLVLHHHLMRMHGRGLTDKFEGGTMASAVDAESVRTWAATHRVRLILHGHQHDPFRTSDGGVIIVNGGRSTKGRHGMSQLQACVLDVSPESIIIDELQLPLVG